jgi:predicted NAD/FAD-binding protein
MLDQPTQDERSILGAIPYTENEAILHTDSRLLPKRRLALASWNYYDIASDQATLTYYINRLQNIKAPEDLYLSMNLTHKIAPEKIIYRMSYAHPCFNQPALKAQKRWDDINGKNNTYFCGAYWGFGFHEDGVTSALEVCRLLGMQL